MLPSAGVRPKKLQRFQLMYEPCIAAWCQDGRIDECMNKIHVHEAGRREEVRTVTTNFCLCDITSFQDKFYVTECDTKFGRVFVYNSIFKITNNIKVGYRSSGGVAVTDRFMFVTSHDKDRVYRAGMPDGGRQKVLIKQDVQRPDCVASNGSKVVVGSILTHTVWVYDTEGNLQFQYGGYGPGPGQLTRPWGVAVDHADIYM